MNKETPEQEAERLYPINSHLEKSQLPIYKIQQLAHITCARMYMGEVERYRKALEMIRDGFDHENDAHKYQNLGACPVCIATEALKTNAHG